MSQKITTDFSEESYEMDQSNSQFEEDNDIELVFGDTYGEKQYKYFYIFKWYYSKLTSSQFKLKKSVSNVFYYKYEPDYT